MTRRLSVRARLTGLVVVVAAGLGLLAATVGVGAVEQRLVNDAVDVAVTDQLSVVEEVLFFSELSVEGIDDDFFDDEFIAMDEIAFVQAQLFELQNLGVFDEFAEAAGVQDGEPLAVLTNFGRLALLDIGTGEAAILSGNQFPDSVIVPQLTVEELFSFVVEIDFDDIFAAEVLGEQGVGDGAAGESLDIRFITSALDGQEYLLVAEIGDVTRSLDSIRSLAWISIPILVLVGGLATWLLTGRALRPVHAITARVAEISGGTLHERVPVPGTDDEVADLATTMNLMLDRLEVDDQRLRQFVSDASHELRSPVAVLRSEAEVALRNPESSTVATLAEGVLGESTRLQRIVEDLLVLARGDEGSAAHASPIDLDDIVLAEASRRRAVPVDTQGVSAGRIRGSQDAAGRIVTHLLDNAARHAAGNVWIGLRTEHGQVTLWVDDDGDGIADADRRRVFERFTRLDAARTRDGGGAGLGLAVVRETATSTGGTVEVTNAPSGGARFVVRWPQLTD